MSTARAECVIAPDETYSAPVSAYSSNVSQGTPAGDLDFCAAGYLGHCLPDI